jgi:purine-cytosine permease-like protein
LSSSTPTVERPVERPAADATPASIRRIESRSIDYVPAAERHGRLTDQATIWFAGSAQLLSLATGAIGISLGLNLFWTLIALALGTVLGTIPVAAHASQGPHLGLPQMVQSRPQFGRHGALFIWAVAILVYWGYVVSCLVLLGPTAEQLGLGNSSVWLVLLSVVAFVFAVYGYDWLHVGQRIVTAGLVLFLVIFTIGIAFGGHIPSESVQVSGTFHFTNFLIVVSAALAYQLSWAFFVSDYSRYMPDSTSHRSIIAMTAIGAGTGVFWMEALGAIGTSLFPEAGLTVALQDSANLVFNGLGEIIVVLGGVALVIFAGMCAYGGSLTLISATDSLKPTRPNRGIRVNTLLLIAVTATVVALLLPDDFLNTTFYPVLAVLGYLMAPWTAINLVDYFVVRRGKYSIREIFNPVGMYGRWNRRGITAYFVAFAAMVPFMYVSFFHGPIANALDGVDLAFFVGVPVAAVLYWSLCRSLDVESEWRIIPEADRDIDAVAEAIV